MDNVEGKRPSQWFHTSPKAIVLKETHDAPREEANVREYGQVSSETILSATREVNQSSTASLPVKPTFLDGPSGVAHNLEAKPKSILENEKVDTPTPFALGINAVTSSFRFLQRDFLKKSPIQIIKREPIPHSLAEVGSTTFTPLFAFVSTWNRKRVHGTS